ncbi:hypothetical protein N7U66_01615 [Lacinutrix neustonica]|uniref:Uncharacterized protein n=1 Tax=Lacinutrix neustonica TaxID=2980107 RepID=A0A9E8MWZ8_9FLAO|nr:hypothetical protein [Lacinutrix neustonica]WAC02439.1 hypothetical protein N7U66_01615 [Lacinutrix neustonica]
MGLQDLIVFIYFLLFIMVLLWAALAYSLIYRYFRTKERIKIKMKVIDAIALRFLDHKRATYKMHWLRRYVQSKRQRWFIAGIFLKVNNVITTLDDTSLKTMAADIGLTKVLSQDLKSLVWQKKAKALLFCYELGLTEHLKTITSYRNHSHILIRREAQIALVVLLGWKSLKLFPYITYPISLWQQIRIIEKLKIYHPEPIEKFVILACQTENPYVMELLVRIIRSFDLEHFKGYSIAQIESPELFLAETALETLQSFELNTLDVNQINLSLQRMGQSPFKLKVDAFISQHGNRLSQQL